MSGHTLKEHGGSNLGVQPVWHLDQDFGRDGCLLRVGTANSPVHDGITYAHAIYAITHRRYQPCRFKAWDGRQAWRRSSAASTGGNIGEVYADGLNVHQRLSLSGGGAGAVLILQYLRAAKFMHSGSLHLFELPPDVFGLVYLN